MANTINNISLANTFGEWVATTVQTVNELNTIGKQDWYKDSGTFHIDSSGVALDVSNTSIFRGAVSITGIGSSLTVNKNADVRGVLYVSNQDNDANPDKLVFSANGVANVNYVNIVGAGLAANVSNNMSVGGILTITGNTSTSSDLIVTKDVTANNGTITYDWNVGRNITANENIVANSGTVWANTVSAPNIRFGTSIIGEAGSSVTSDLGVFGSMAVSGNFTITGTTVYTSNTLTINDGQVGNFDGYFRNYRQTGANAEIRWVESTKSWSVRDVDNATQYNRILSSNDYTSINTSISSAFSAISSNVATLNNNISANVVTLNTNISANATTQNNNLVSNVNQLNNNISANVASLNNNISSNVTSATTTLNNNISANVALINNNITSNVTSANSYTASQVVLLNNNISSNVSTINNNISANATTVTTNLNNNISANVTSINNNISANVATLNNNITANVTAASGVSAGTYGGTTAIPVYTVDARGRLTYSANVSITAGATLQDDTSTAATFYPVYANTTTGTYLNAFTSSSKYTYNPSTGTLSATIFNSLSDASLKLNVQPVVNAIDVLKQIQGVSFNWKDNGNKSYGVIAQNIENVLPDIVTTTDDGIKTVNYQALTAFLIEAVKELSNEVEQLKNK